jgi:hypothetical protein
MIGAGGYVDEWERNRRAAIAEFRTSFEPLRRDLMAAGIDPSDFGRFVGRVVPGLIEPSGFDEDRAVPLLLKWLPRVENKDVRECIVRHLDTRARGLSLYLR